MQPYQFEDGSIHWGLATLAPPGTIMASAGEIKPGNAPLALFAILEEMVLSQRAGYKTLRIYIRRDLFKHIHSAVRYDPRARLVFRYDRDKTSNKLCWHIDGVPVSWTVGKKPYYLMTDRGELK